MCENSKKKNWVGGSGRGGGGGGGRFGLGGSGWGVRVDVCELRSGEAFVKIQKKKIFFFGGGGGGGSGWGRSG